MNLICWQDQVSWDCFPLLPPAFQKEASCSISLQASSEVFLRKDRFNFSKKLFADVFAMCCFSCFLFRFLNALGVELCFVTLCIALSRAFISIFGCLWCLWCFGAAAGALGAPALVLAVAALVILVVFGGARRTCLATLPWLPDQQNSGDERWNTMDDTVRSKRSKR
jgi:hypothetical protein